MSKVSIIVPVYNVAPFIGKSATSLFEQTFEDIEYVFVNDGSTDESISKLKKTAARYEKRNVVIIENERNSGSATTRNKGLSHATGEYLIFADADDWAEPEEIETLFNTISEKDLDIVYCDYFESYSDHEKIIKQEFGENQFECIDAMLRKGMHGSTWNKIYRRQFLIETGVAFIDGADLFEDVGWNIRLFASTDRIGYLPKAFYHYVQYNDHSIIKSMSDEKKNRERALQRIWNVDAACCFLEKKGLKERLAKGINEMRLMAKNDLIAKSDYSLKRWIATFPEADQAIWNCNRITTNYKIMLTMLHYKQTALFLFYRDLLSSVRR